MKIVINNNGERIPATLEVVDGVMIVIPKESSKEEKVDISQFKTGDVITCGWDENGQSCSWVCILDEIEEFGERYFIEDFCNMYLDRKNRPLCTQHDYSDSATFVRLATEEEKKKLFDALAKEGKAWDAEKKAVVDLKWKPKIGDKYNYPIYNITDDGMHYGSATTTYTDCLFDKRLIKQNLAFKTKEECEAYCLRLNEVIKEVKP